MKNNKTFELKLDPTLAIKVPSSLRILNSDYPIRYTDCNKLSCRGICNYEVPEIEIDNTLTNPQLIRETILHEALHAILEKINHEHNDENLVRDLTVGIDALFQDNKDLLSLYNIERRL